MTPRDKAQDLFNKFNSLLTCEGQTTGQTPIDCAFIAVNEIIEIIPKVDFHDKWTRLFWGEVKYELEKM